MLTIDCYNTLQENNMNKDKLHLVPTMVVDSGTSALNPLKPDYQRDIYYAKIQATAQYCSEVIAEYEKKYGKK